MDDFENAALGVGFDIDATGSFETLARLDSAIDRATANAIEEFNRVERASAGMLNLNGAQASLRSFGGETTQAMRAAAREIATVEKAGERLVSQVERQSAAFGKSREELRLAKVEAAALAAEQQGLTELAGRLRAAESDLAGKELAAARRARFEAEALAQQRDEAESRAAMQAARERAAAELALIQQLQARAQIESLLDRNFGVGRVRATDAGATFSALAARAAEEEAQAVRSAALAHELFEAKVREGVAAMKAEAEVARQGALAQKEQELRSASVAYSMFEARARAGLAAMREADAAAASDAAALGRLRAMLDPAAAAYDRLNQELAEARRLMTAAGASAEELARAEQMLIDRAGAATQQHHALAAAGTKTSFAMKNVAIQMPDVIQGLLTSQPPMTIFIQQGAQIFQVAQMAEGGLRGFGKELALMALRFAPLLAGLAAAGAGFALFTRWVGEGVTNDQLTRDLGKITGGANATKAELYKLREETISFGDVAKATFEVIGKDISGAFVSDMKGMSKSVKEVLDDLTSYGRQSLAAMYAGLAGTRDYLGTIEKGGLIGLGKMMIGQGDPKLLEKTYGAAYAKADKYLSDLGKRIRTESIDNARHRLADKIGYNTPAVDRHAAALAREAEAVEAQIRNLYALADAYGVSGGAALIAEARVKAESDAIKKRGDIESFVNRQIQLSIAQRVMDGAKANAAMDDQSRIQTEVNTAVANGLIPAERANDLLRERMAELPLLAAIEAAQQRGLAKEAGRATQALDELHAAQERARAAAIGARFVAVDQAADRRLAELEKERDLIGATDAARVKALATLKATQELSGNDFTGAFATDYIAKQVKIAENQQQLQLLTNAYNDSLHYQADLFDAIATNVQAAGRGMADAFGEAGRALGDMATVFAGHLADQQRLSDWQRDQLRRAGDIQVAEVRARKEREITTLYALRSGAMQIGVFGDLAASAKGFFDQGSTGYQALAGAEKAFRAVQFALSVRAIAQDAIETGSAIAKSGARAAAHAVEAVAKAIAGLPFPLNIAAGAATAGVLASIGLSVAGAFGGGGGKLPEANAGTGTVLGDSAAKSESLKRSLDALKEVDTITSVYAREMATSLRSIDNQIGGLASVLVRAGDINASAGITEGFKTDTTGSLLKGIVTGGGLFSKVPVIGGIIGAVGDLIGSLFGSTTTVIGNGLYGGAQSLGSVLSGGFDASYYSDVEKKKRFLGITTGKSYSTQYTGAEAGLENQFTLILREFNNAIVAAAGPLGAATGDIQARLNGFVVDIGKIDLKGLTGTQIQEKLTAVFGAAADRMADSAFPGFQRFAKVGEGAFETLVRVASTVEAATNALNDLGGAASALGIDAKMGLVAQFDSVSAFTSATDAFFEGYYSKAEQSAAKTARLGKVFDSLGLSMPSSLSAFRSLVEAQNLTTTAGQATYATLLKLAPAFADLQSALEGAKSAADIASERADLERKLLEVNGDTAALRALDLAKLDASNRALQTQIWAIQDAQEAAKAADELRKAWAGVGDSIMEEVKRIRGLTDAGGGGSFAAIMGEFNAANTAARGGDQDAAKLLPSLSQSLLTAAGNAATSRQELDRIRAQTAAQLEATWAAIQGRSTAPVTGAGSGNPAMTAIDYAQSVQQAAAPANDDLVAELRSLREEVAQLRNENNAGNAAIASNTGKTAKKLDDVTAANGGEAITVAGAA